MGSIGFNQAPSTATPDNTMEEINVHPGVYKGAVVNVTWAQLEPTQGTFDFSAIESGLHAIATYNAKYPATPVVGKLRVFVGKNYPSWLTTVAGGPITIAGYNGSIQIAAYWTAGYRTEWQSLQTALAAKYDADQRIAEVSATSCSSKSDEPFVEPLNHLSQAALHAAGYTDALGKSCLLGMTADYAAWTKTPLDYTFNPFHYTDSLPIQEDDAFTIQVMQQWRNTLGARAIVANHSLRSPTGANLQPIFTELALLGKPIAMQTASQQVITSGNMSWNDVIHNGLAGGASEIEIWRTVDAGGDAQISLSMLQQWSAEF